VARGCLEGYRAAYPGRAFEGRFPEGAVPMQGVPDAIAQLLDKLVENALDFAAPGTPLRLSLVAGGGRACLALENDGPPIPEAVRGRLFDSMVTSREEGQGRGGHLGLGLAIVRLVASYHGGEARAVNLADGRGVRFEVELPVA
jgi:signal transduction histidine kinase